VCLNLQAPQTIGFLGPEATYSHIAATRAFGRSARFVPYESITDIFRAVEKHQAHFGIVPIENSTGGVIHVTLDELMTSELSICAEIYIPIRHNLLCLGPKSKIKRICTHPQVLSQCRVWLRENLPGVQLIEVGSSGEGAKLARKDKRTATIGSKLAAELYKLPILEEGIEDQKDNVTRFLIIGKQSPRPSGNDRTSVMFSIKDEPGALFHLLQPFAQRKINLTKIESRPTRRRAWDYIFFLDIEGHISKPEILEAVESLRPHCTFLRVLGSYPVDRERELGKS
ncbi:prephenate dehydratase, partial [Candidatus Sumerlaeota bacterium]|nr:prephenate dehydratase [Candidatus Sumerlaeota bacterium]